MDIRSTKLFKFWQRYEHHLNVAAVIVGFCFDLIIAKRPDSVFNNTLLLSYLFVAGAFIIILNLRETRRKEGTSAEPFVLLLVLQFCFGGLASNLLILYGHSGTLTGSAIFIGLLVCVIFGNEYFRDRYTLLRFNIAVYYFLLLTYTTVAVPTFLTHSIGTLTFLLSCLISLVYIAGFLAVLFYTVLRGVGRKQLFEVSFMVGLIVVVFVTFYFLNVIPPVPLSLRDIGVYHSVLKRQDGSYVAVYEPAPWWAFWQATSGTYTLGQGSSAFCYSSVFAPSALEAPIYHRWEFKAANGWETYSRVAFPISGGRDDGYRGFSVKTALAAGQWRCDVETAQGSLIGRVGFTVVQGSSVPPLSQTVL